MKFLLALTILLVLFTAGCAKPRAKQAKAGYMPFNVEVGEYAILDAKSGKFASNDALVKAMLAADVIFVGEEHDHTVGHMYELKLLQDLFAAGRTELSVSLEMFERDVQKLLDSYLVGSITEKTFTDSSRPWPNYVPDYRGLVEFAKANALPVLAANIPRALAMTVAKDGMDALPKQSRQFVAAQLYAPEDEYKERFIAIMKAMGDAHSAQAMPVSEKMLDATYRAQCIKDDTMAESITNHIAATGRKVIHYNGCFHSDYGFGTAARVSRNMPNLKVLVIKITRNEEKIQLPLEDFDGRIADFVITFTK